MRVGVLTFHRCINYGSFWQADCLVRGLREIGHEPLIIDHRSKRVDLAEWRCALDPNPERRSTPIERDALLCKTRKVLEEVSTLPQTEPVDLESPEDIEAFDAIVIGSDEVWNLRHPWYSAKPVFFGQGLKTQKLISYAASFGNYSCWEGIGHPWTTFLRAFNHISVRDENSWWMLKNSLGLEPQMSLDPCLAWPPVVTSQTPQAPYAIVYGHGFSQGFARNVQEWAKERRVRLVSIGYLNEWADTQWLDASPTEFTKAVAGAEAVATNFFHGCVFALANQKPFACESTPYRSIKLRGLMELLGTEARLGSDVENLLCLPTEFETEERINQLRCASIEYLQRALDA